MAFQDEYMADIRANIAAHEAAERTRIDKLVKEASKSTELFAAERALADRQAEQEREHAHQAREQARIQQERDDAQRRYLSAGGSPAGFEGWYAVEQQRLVNERIAAQQTAARYHYQKTF